jgi:hypothetical protein
MDAGNSTRLRVDLKGSCKGLEVDAASGGLRVGDVTLETGEVAVKDLAAALGATPEGCELGGPRHPCGRARLTKPCPGRREVYARAAKPRSAMAASLRRTGLQGLGVCRGKPPSRVVPSAIATPRRGSAGGAPRWTRRSSRAST